MAHILPKLGGLAIMGVAGFVLISQPSLPQMSDYEGLTADAAHGEAVFWAAGCASCHAAADAKGDAELVLAGGQEFASDFGTFLAPNISPDPVAGIGGWSLAAICRRRSPKASAPRAAHLYPALPYAAYNKMTPQDVTDLWAYMQSLPPSATPSQPHRSAFRSTFAAALGVWKRMFVTTDWVIEGDLTPEQIAGPLYRRGRGALRRMSHAAQCFGRA